MAEHIGQQFGNYQLLKRLGSGGFAEVYLGKHIYLETQAAIKISLGQLTPSQEEEFRDEARTIAKLIHPHIVRVLEYGIAQNGMPFFVMDYAPHGTLRYRHPPKSTVPLPTILSYVKQTAAALQFAHDNKIIHRDVKPENLLLDANEDILLSDFGIFVNAHSSLSQKTEKVIGTWLYTPPEQFKGKPLSASDQYALGIVVYEWLCGFPPFQGSFVELYHQHFSVTPPPFEKKLNIPDQVEQVVMKALAKDPQQRFSSIQEFATALEQAYQRQQSPLVVQKPPKDEQLANVQKELLALHERVRSYNDPLSLYLKGYDAEYYEENRKGSTNDHANYFMNKGKAMAQLGRYQEALEAFNRAIKHSPNWSYLLECKGDCFTKFGKTEEARKTYEAALLSVELHLNNQPCYIPDYENKGDLLSKLGRHEEAHDAYEITLTLIEEEYTLGTKYSEKGRILTKLGRLEEAIQMYDQAIKHNPTFYHIFRNKGKILEKLGRFEDALSCLRKAELLDNNFYYAMNSDNWKK